MPAPAPSFELNGDEPPLIGSVCTALVLEQLIEGRTILDPVNVAHLRFEARWYRLYFECATVFWRSSDGPRTPENSDLAHGLLLNDLSGMAAVVGQELEAIRYAGFTSGDVRVDLIFTNGRCLRFSHDCASETTEVSEDDGPGGLPPEPVGVH